MTHPGRKLYVQEARPRIAEELGITPKELAGMHRRFEVIPGAQAQVDWGDEGKILAHMGIPKVYSFHMTLSYSRDPFCCFTTSQDLRTFFDCHRRAFAHFGGVPMTIVYDRTKTVVRRHVAPGEAVPLHPEAVGFAGHYDFDIDVLAAYRPTGKGRVERQVLIVRDHVLAGRAFSSIEEMDAAFMSWVPLRRAQVHKTHREIIGHRAARDHAALKPLPPTPYLVTERHLRPVGKDSLIAFDGNLYSVPARKVVPVSWWRSGPRSRRSCCTPPSPTQEARRCWPCTPERSAAVSASSKTTGTVCPPAKAGGPLPATSQPSRVTTNGSWAMRRDPCRLC
ncbi:IS21 family transposase [Streptomyces lavendulocolor]|uniref:IS21 family transposase n=1 Tax=Streptomyces lavendulocolor TaxID=67316 RepID=UPI003F4D48A5